LIGTLYRVALFGESHGPGVGSVVLGCPPGVAFDASFIQTQLDRRRPGQSAVTTQRKEADLVQVLSGVHKDVTWQAYFRKGSRGDEFSKYPTLAEVRHVWQEITPLLVQAMENAGKEQLSAPAPRDFPIPDKTVRGAFLFLAFHESYHVGQMSYLRKCLGKDGLVG